MTDVLIGLDGMRVERILVQRHFDRSAREMLRVRRGRYLVADCATVDEVARLVDLATLVPEQRTPSLSRDAFRGGSLRCGSQLVSALRPWRLC